MIDPNRYPNLNDVQHDRPQLSIYGYTVFSELIWLAIPLIVIAIVSLLR